MTILDWSQCSAVESVPDRLGGAWVFRDTRLPVATVIENLEDLTIAQVMEQFDVTQEQIAAVLDFVALSDKLSKGKREAGLELLVIDEAAVRLRVSRWDIFEQLDSAFKKIAASVAERVERSRVENQ